MDNVFSVGDMQKANSRSSMIDKGDMKKASSFLQDLKGVLEVTKEITGVDIMGKFKEVAMANKEEGSTSSNAVKIQSGIEKQMSQQPIAKTISINTIKAISSIDELLKNVDETKTVKELKEEFTTAKESGLLEPLVVNFIQGVTFLQ